MATALNVPATTPPSWRFNGLYWFHVGKYVLWVLVTGFIIGCLAVNLSAEGIRRFAPSSAKKVAKTQGFEWMANVKPLAKTDLAYWTALLIVLGVMFFWDRIVALWAGRPEDFDHRRFDPLKNRQLILLVGGVLIVADAALFYLGIANSRFRSTGISFPALLATAAYTAALVGISYVSVGLRQDCLEARYHRD